MTGERRQEQLRRRCISAGCARCLVISLTEAHAVAAPDHGEQTEAIAIEAGSEHLVSAGQMVR